MKTKRVVPRKLKGFQDLTPEKMEVRSLVEAALRKEARAAGFQEVSTPSLEHSDTLLGAGGETDKQVFRFLDNGKRDVALRFDLTMSFARFVAENQGTLIFPFKRLQIGNVWRAEKPQKGRFREFAQADLDIIGVATPAADIEVVLCFAKALDRILDEPFTISLGHRKILSAILKKTLGPLTVEEESSVLITLDKLEKIGEESVKQQLCQQIPSLTEENVSLLLGIMTLQENSIQKMKAQLETFLDEEDLPMLENFVSVVDSLQTLLTDSQAKIELNLATVRGLGYYTGTVFETTVDRAPEFGSIASGGRYDELNERFISQPHSGMGGSIGVDRLVSLLVERNQERHDSQRKKIAFVAFTNTDFRLHAFRLVSELRKRQIDCEIALTENKLKPQIKYADRMNYNHVVLIGDQEVAQERFTLKSLDSGKQREGLTLEELIECLQN